MSQPSLSLSPGSRRDCGVIQAPVCRAEHRADSAPPSHCLFSPHLAQLNKCCTLRKEVAAASTAKKIRHSTAQKSSSRENRIRHQRVGLAEAAAASSCEIPTKRKTKGSRNEIPCLGTPRTSMSIPRGIILFVQQTENPKRLKFTSLRT